MRHEVERYLKLGFRDHLAKPIDRSVFAEKVAHYLNAPKLKEVTLPQDEYSQLQEKYINGLHEQKVQIMNLAKYQDLDGLAKAVHTVKGTAGMFGCENIHKQAVLLDEALKLNETTRLDKLVNDLVKSIDRTIGEGCQNVRIVTGKQIGRASCRERV